MRGGDEAAPEEYTMSNATMIAHLHATRDANRAVAEAAGAATFARFEAMTTEERRDWATGVQRMTPGPTPDDYQQAAIYADAAVRWLDGAATDDDFRAARALYYASGANSAYMAHHIPHARRSEYFGAIWCFDRGIKRT